MNSGLGRAEAALKPETERSRNRRPVFRPLAILRALCGLSWSTWTEIRRGASPVVFIAIGVIAAVTAFLLPAIGSAARAELLLEIVFSIVSILSTVVLIFVVAPLTPRDLEERTAITVLSKPTPRWVFALGRGGGFTLAATIFGVLALGSSFLTLKLLASSAFDGTPQQNPTRLVEAEGPQAHGRLVFLSGFPATLRWLTTDAGPHDSTTRFRFPGEDVKRCAAQEGWIRLKMAGLNTSINPMSEIVTLQVSMVRESAPDAAVRIETTLREREARIELAELPGEWLEPIEGGEMIRVEVRPAAFGHYVEAEHGSAALAIPGASSLVANFALAGIGALLTMLVICWVTFAGSILFSAKLSMLLGFAYVYIGYHRDSLAALLRMVGGTSRPLDPGTVIDPMKVMEELSKAAPDSGGFVQSLLQTAINGLSFVVPDLTRFSLESPLLEGFCVSSSEVLVALRIAGTWVLALMAVSALIMATRRLR